MIRLLQTLMLLPLLSVEVFATEELLPYSRIGMSNAASEPTSDFEFTECSVGDELGFLWVGAISTKTYGNQHGNTQSDIQKIESGVAPTRTTGVDSALLPLYSMISNQDHISDRGALIAPDSFGVSKVHEYAPENARGLEATVSVSNAVKGNNLETPDYQARYYVPFDFFFYQGIYIQKTDGTLTRDISDFVEPKSALIEINGGKYIQTSIHNTNPGNLQVGAPATVRIKFGNAKFVRRTVINQIDPTKYEVLTTDDVVGHLYMGHHGTPLKFDSRPSNQPDTESRAYYSMEGSHINFRRFEYRDGQVQKFEYRMNQSGSLSGKKKVYIGFDSNGGAGGRHYHLGLSYVKAGLELADKIRIWDPYANVYLKEEAAEAYYGAYTWAASYCYTTDQRGIKYATAEMKGFLVPRRDLTYVREK